MISGGVRTASITRTSGNLDRRGVGDIDTLTVREYLALSCWRPARVSPVPPSDGFVRRRSDVFVHSAPTASAWPAAGRGPWFSTMATNVAIALVVAAVMWWVGVGPFLLVHLPITMLGGAAGVWLFYVQHQFEQTIWSRRSGVELSDGGAVRQLALRLARGILRWFTANIGVHHVHHLCSRIPYYRLPLRSSRSSRTPQRKPADKLSQSLELRSPRAVGRNGAPGSLRFAKWLIALLGMVKAAQASQLDG